MKSPITTLLLLSPLLTTASPLPTASNIARETVNQILALISEFFPIGDTLAAAQDLIGGADELFADALGYDITQSDLLSGECGDVVVIFARGTDEPGNVGALAGPPFFDALSSALSPSGKTVVVQGVDDYGATVTGFLEGGDPVGSTEMATLVTKAFTQCPNSAIVMSGWSQGGQLVHNAAAQLPAATMAAVSSVVIFGDPDDGTPVTTISSSRVLVICHTGDDICAGGDLILLPHLTYFEDAGTAAAFVVGNL